MNNFINKVSSLPEPLKSLLYSDRVGLIIQDALHLANVDEKIYFDPLMEKVTQVLTLDISLNEFSNYINNENNLTTSQKQIIDSIIKEKIFNPVLPLLKREILEKQEKTNKINKQPVAFQPTIQQISSLTKKIPFPDLSKVLTPKNKTTEIPSPSFQKKIIEESTQSQTAIRSEQEIKVSPELSNVSSTSSSLQSKKEQEIENKKIEKTDTTPLPEIKIPEPVDIKIEKPIQQNIEPPPITIPEVSNDKKEKIKETLLKVMTSKKSETPKIVEEMEKLEKTPLKRIQQTEIKKEKSTAQISEISQVVSSKNNKFGPQERKTALPTSKTSVLNVRIKEFKEQKEKLPQTTEPIAYQKHIQKEEKPFGET